MQSLAGQTVLITGASSGIGAACATVISANGAKLIINARRRARLESIARHLSDRFGISTCVCPFDVRRFENVKTALEALPSEWNTIDVLINNAGLARGRDKLQDGNTDDWDETIDTNVKGLLYVTRLVLPGMLERGRGHVVNIASVAGIETYPYGNVYCASKAAVRMISDALRRDLLGTPIRVTTISPGMVQTEFSEVRFHGNKNLAAKVYQGYTPLAADDVAEAVLFALTRPAHVNISEIVLMPTDQAGPNLLYRRDNLESKA